MLSASMGDMRPCSIAADSSTCLLLVHRGWKIGRSQPAAAHFLSNGGVVM